MPTARQMLCANMFLEYSPYSKNGVAAIIGNYTAESGINLPTAFRTSGLDHGSQGLAQWRDSRTHKRLSNYQNFVKKLQPQAHGDELWAYYGRMEYQVRFTVHEMETDFPGLHKRLKGTEDVITLTDMICWQYERPNKQLAHLDVRRKHAKLVFQALQVQEKEPAPAPLPPIAEKVAQDAERRTGTAIAAGAGIGALSWLGNVSWPILVILGLLILVIIVHAALQRSRALKLANEVKTDPIDEIVDRVLERLDERANETLTKDENNG